MARIKVKSETKKEGWVQFMRIPCKKGFIDRWMGDVADNPNNEKRSQQHLNTITTYFRLNGKGKWASQRDFKKSVSMEIGLNIKNSTAEEIWYDCLGEVIGSIM